MTSFPRFKRCNPSQIITIDKRREASTKEKLLILLTAERWGCRSVEKTYAEKIRVTRAASRLVAYDNGFVKEFSMRSISRWDTAFTNEIKNGCESNKLGEKKRIGSISTVDQIENSNPGYLHHLF